SCVLTAPFAMTKIRWCRARLATESRALDGAGTTTDCHAGCSDKMSVFMNVLLSLRYAIAQSARCVPEVIGGVTSPQVPALAANIGARRHPDVSPSPRS